MTVPQHKKRKKEKQKLLTKRGKANLLELVEKGCLNYRAYAKLRKKGREVVACCRAISFSMLEHRT